MRAVRIGSVVGIVAVFVPTLLIGCDMSRGAKQTTLVIDSRPVQGADIAINGEPSGLQTPSTVTLPGGASSSTLVQVSKVGYKTAWRNVTSAEGGEQRVVLTMEPEMGYLSVDSQPPGAEVRLEDGTVVGKTPVNKVPIQVGTHTYELRLDRYKPVRKEFSVEEYYPSTFVHQLEPEPAQLEVISRPSNALVFINEQFQGKRSPATFEVAPGTYTVSVEQTGFVTTEQNVTLGPGDQQSVVLEMKEGNVPPGMVFVPGGEFLMGFDDGAPDEKPERRVTVEAFYIDKFEVTNQEFKRIFPDHNVERGKENFPVTKVTWEQAKAYATAVGKRLPTEEEWEKAARGEDGREYPWGNQFDPTMCNSAEKPTLGVEEVGTYRVGASPYGAMDMAGNAFEWTASWYNAYPGNTSIEKDYGQVFRVLRGGSYRSNKFDVRCASRHYDRMNLSSVDYGFRCAKDAVAGPSRAGSTPAAGGSASLELDVPRG